MSQLRWFRHFVRMPPGGFVLTRPTGRRSRDRQRTQWRDYISLLAWECLGIPQEELEMVAGGRVVWVFLLDLLCP